MVVPKLPGFPRLVTTMGDLSRAVDRVSDEIREGLDLANKTQKASLALGMNLVEMREKLGSSLDGLRGSINQKLVAGFEVLEAGLQGNTKGVTKLINQQMLTGTNYKKTAKAFAALHSIAGVQNNAMVGLSENLIKTANEYTITTDVLVDAFMSFEKQFAALNMTGMGQSFTEAIAQLQGQLGPQLAGSLQQVMKIIMQTGVDGMETMAALGIGDVRDQLEMAAGDTAATLEILRNAVVTAGGNFENIAGGANASLLSIGAVTDSLGAGTDAFVPLAAALTEGVRERITADENYANQLKVLMDEIWNPLKLAVMDLLHGALPLLTMASQFLVQISEKVVHKFKEIFVAVGGFSGIIKKIKAIFDFMKPVLAVIAGYLLVKLAIVLAPVIAIFIFLVVAIKVWWALVKMEFNLLFEKFGGLKEWLVNIGKEIKSFISSPLYSLKKGFFTFQEFLGTVILKISEKLKWLLGPSLQAAGMALVESAKIAMSLLEARKKRQDAKSEEEKIKELNSSFISLLEQDRAAFNLQKEELHETKEINRKTPEIDTGSGFLAQSTLLLSENMDRILGVSPRDQQDLFEDMVDILEQINDSTRETAGKEPEGAHAQG